MSEQDLNNYLGNGSVGLPADGDVPVWNARQERFLYAAGSSLSSGVSLVDLGTVNWIDILNGPQTLYAPTIGQFVQIVTGTAGYVAGDTQSLIVVIPDDIAETGLYFLRLPPNISVGTLITDTRPGWVVRGTPINVYYTADNSGLVITNEPLAWQANHAYPQSGTNAAYAIVESGHLWTTPDSGTSGNSKPDFAGNIGGTVTDNDITWTDEGAVPTQGTIHLFALVS